MTQREAKEDAHRRWGTAGVRLMHEHELADFPIGTVIGHAWKTMREPLKYRVGTLTRGARGNHLDERGASSTSWSDAIAKAVM